MSDSGKSLYGMSSLVSDVAAHTSGITEKQVREVLKTAFSTIMSRLASKERVSIANFGAWRPTERVSRTNRNIRIGPMIQVAARRAVTWSPGTEFNNRMKGTYARANHDAAVRSSGRSNTSSSEGGSPSRSRSVGGRSG